MIDAAREHAWARSATSRLFETGELRDGKFRRLHEHLRGCEECRRFYDRASAIKRTLDVGAPPVPADELRLLARAAARAAARPAIAPRRGALWLAGALAGALGLSFIVLARPTAPPRGELQARGSTPSAAPGVGVRAFCLSPKGEIVGSVELSDRAAAAPSLACGLEDSLQFAYSRPAASGKGAAARLWLVATPGAGEPLVYPLGRDADSVPLRAGALELPIPGSVRLAARHRPGSYRLAAVVSAASLDREALAKAGAGELPANGSASFGRLEVTP